MRRMWSRFRGWRWWVQALVVLGIVSALAAPFTGEEDAGQVATAVDVADQLPLASTTTVTTTTTSTTAAPTTTTASPTTTAPPTTAARAPLAASPTTTAPVPPPTTAAPSAYFENCTAAWNAGAAPVHRGDPGYGSHLDRDGDGIGCERDPR